MGEKMTDKKTARTLPGGAGKENTGLAPWLGAGFESMFEDFFRPFGLAFGQLAPGIASPFSLGEAGIRQPTLDFQDRGDHYVLTAELPGYTKDEVEVRVDSSGLELKADKSETGTKGSKDGSYESSSRRSFYQYVSLPDQVVAEKIEGTMKNGVLELRLPKSRSSLPDSRRVDLK